MRKARIIIFDDDLLILGLLADFFSDMNFEVQCFAQPLLCFSSESTKSCLTPCADIIIIDYRMPERNGLELLHHQKQRECPINIKNKAIMSGDMSEECLAETMEVAGVFFRKPFHFNELTVWMKDCLNRLDLSWHLDDYKTM